MYGPVVVTVVVNGSLPIEQKTILASLQGQSPILAQIELVTEFGMGMSCYSIGIRAVGNISRTLSHGDLDKGRGYEDEGHGEVRKRHGSSSNSTTCHFFG